MKPPHIPWPDVFLTATPFRHYKREGVYWLVGVGQDQSAPGDATPAPVAIYLEENGAIHTRVINQPGLDGWDDDVQGAGSAPRRRFTPYRKLAPDDPPDDMLLRVPPQFQIRVTSPSCPVVLAWGSGMPAAVWNDREGEGGGFYSLYDYAPYDTAVCRGDMRGVVTRDGEVVQIGDLPGAVAYLKGRHAVEKKMPVEANPYPRRDPDDHEWYLWQRGWKDRLFDLEGAW